MEDDAHYWGNFFSSFLALLIVAVVVLVYLKKKYGFGDTKLKPQNLKVIERLQIGHKSQLIVINYDEQRLLISQSGEIVTFLTELKSNKQVDTTKGNRTLTDWT
jgi:flagellar biogenesis protein FliO